MSAKTVSWAAALFAVAATTAASADDAGRDAGFGAWTNASGRVFAARLVALDDRAATFVFAEDGATNTLALADLAPACRERAREAFDLPEIPPALAATWRLTLRTLRQTDALAADGRLKPELAAARRANVMAAFRKACRERGLTANRIAALIRRLAACSVTQGAIFSNT